MLIRPLHKTVFNESLFTRYRIKHLNSKPAVVWGILIDAHFMISLNAF